MMNNLVFWCSLVCFASWSQVCSAQGTTAAAALPATLKVWVGGEQDKELSLFTFDTAKNTFDTKVVKSDALGPNVLWLEFNKAKTLMISASGGEFGGVKGTGGVFTASVAADGTLTKVSSAPTDEAPVSIELSKDEKLVMVANFNGGSIQTYDMDATGKFTTGKAKETFKFLIDTPGPVKDRQQKAAAHQVKLDPSGELLLVPDLGMDKVHSFTLDPTKHTLTKNKDIPIDLGCGPRHLAFDPTRSKPEKPVFYLLCELSSQLLYLEVTDPKAAVTVLQKKNVRPPKTRKNTFNAAEILISPDGKFLYTTNRQKDPAGKVTDNIFTVFSRNEKNGKLTRISDIPSGGKEPRQFGFSPDADATFVAVTNLASNLVSMHKRDPTTGALTFLKSAESKAPVMALIQA
ncbi:hypothetical protein PTTG_12483 [Puccinia triticina 1-1 BBBD Race 1]|uniref:6-phosphogluconolactonase n=1 Tax=Puccinia triticina (isolate 1-1 / race 1 (BBBD)) TaxID=630390 RepID=A0A180GE86_PUCT1|nr:hypothetical protein PTTG_12483 [Puccinia triticina 1-1 BBBD Race 1]